MTHDFAKKNSPKKKKASKSQVPGWVWLFTGIVAGVFISFLGFLTDINPEESAQQIIPAVKDVKETIKKKASSTKFDFYTLLPEREIIVPSQDKTPSEDTDQFHFILQAGSFKNSEDADRLRAKLILLGLDVNLEPVTSSNGDTWHRVQVGPFLSQSKLAKARSTLINQGIDTLLLKRKVDS